jgi:pimeloyl-ACP methyl ester carboxylesterase
LQSEFQNTFRRYLCWRNPLNRENWLVDTSPRNPDCSVDSSELISCRAAGTGEFDMTQFIVRCIAIAMTAVISGCVPLSEFPAPPRVRYAGLAQANRWVLSARRRTFDREEASGECLAALRTALSEDSPQARDLANAALGRFVEINCEDGRFRSSEVVGPDGIAYHVRLVTEEGDWPIALLQKLEAIRPSQGSAGLQWAGWGVPVIGASKPDRVNQPFEPGQGYRLPVTVVADMHSRNGVHETTIRLVNSEVTASASIGGQSRPIAGDLQAPNRATFRRGSPFFLGLRGLFRVNRFAYPTNLIFMQPYDPNRIPVVLVHGLLSTPMIWSDVVSNLQKDPVIRKKFQFFAFYYPNGQPIPASALDFRNALRAVETRYPSARDMVLVGHSMGGIISRAQVSSSGGMDLFNEVFGVDAPRVAKRLPNAPLLRDSLVFERDENVGRVIFICVPHRGSNLAQAGPAGFFAMLIRLPYNIAGAVSEIADVVTTMDLRRPPTSIYSLSPRSPFLHALNQRPIEVPHHSILGDRGRGDSPNSSDGVVRYASAHLETAESELIVPAGHSAFRHPMAIEEIRRILYEHMNQSAR